MFFGEGLHLFLIECRALLLLFMRLTVAVVGDAFVDKGSPKYDLAFETGKMLVDNGYRVQCGGLTGVMEGVCEGAHSSSRYKEGDTIGLIPSYDRGRVNKYVDIVIPTGMDILRNGMTVAADAVVAIGGGAGTLSEIAVSWSTFKLIIAYRTVEGWSSKLADTRLDERIRYPQIPDDKVYGADSPEEVAAILKEKIHLYNRVFNGISGVVPTGSVADCRKNSCR